MAFSFFLSFFELGALDLAFYGSAVAPLLRLFEEE